MMTREALQEEQELTAIQDSEDTSSISLPWYALTWTYCVTAASELKNLLLQIPSFVFPDNQNPGEKDILSWIGLSGWPAEILKAIGPIALFYQWKNTIRSFMKIGESENRNFMVYKEAFMNFMTTLAWTFITIASLAGGVALLLQTAPYILTALFALGAVNALINCGMNLYHAFKASSASIRKEYLIQAVKSLLGLVTNTLAFVISFYLNIKVLDAASTLNDNFFTAIAAIGNAFVTSVDVISALTVTTALAFTVATSKINSETWKAITEPLVTLKKIATTLYHNPLEIVPMAMDLVMHTAALLFAPLQLIGKGLFSLLKSKLPEPSFKVPVESKSLPEQIANKIESLDKQLGKDKKVSLNDTSFKSLPEITRTRIAKKEFLVRLQEGKDSAATIASEIKKQQKSLFYSFWRPKKGEVEQLADEYSKQWKPSL